MVRNRKKYWIANILANDEGMNLPQAIHFLGKLRYEKRIYMIVSLIIWQVYI